MRRYLIVDDNEAFAENLGDILTDTGAEVSIATNGQAALELASKNRYDALLSDMLQTFGSPPNSGGAPPTNDVRPSLSI